MPNTPSPAEVKAIREEIGLSVSGFAAALGYPGQDRLVRAWEAGVRAGKPFPMPGSAIQAMKYLRGIIRIMRDYGSSATYEANNRQVLDDLRRILPEELR